MTLATDQSLTLDFNFRGHLDLKIHQNVGRVARVWLRLKPKKLPNYKKTLKKYSRAYFSLNWAQWTYLTDKICTKLLFFWGNLPKRPREIFENFPLPEGNFKNWPRARVNFGKFPRKIEIFVKFRIKSCPLWQELIKSVIFLQFSTKTAVNGLWV